MKILESSQTLLHVLKRETVNLSQRKPFGSPQRQGAAAPISSGAFGPDDRERSAYAYPSSSAAAAGVGSHYAQSSQYYSQGHEDN